ncbi:MAG: beta-galactosidase [Rhizomicrobium sp.]
MKLGVCYYPEHWPEEWWADDARAMTEMGISWVRLGEFAWSRIEPEPGRFDWGWLDRVLETLHAAGLCIVLGTPTATPPKWLVDRDPSMLAVDRAGRPRKFGSRRHYCFSSESYRAECARIVTAIAERYGKHPGVGAWQTDNEYGCHDTTLSYSDAAARRFRSWLARRYNDIASLNRAWGGVFWSQEYRSFDEVDPPNLAVTEVNPSHQLDYNRFASDEVVSFNKLQVDILRKLSPGRDIIHNFMGFYTEFDHHEVGRDLDIAAWDSYPLGFLEQFLSTVAEKARYLRQGHPDIAAFHHDLYRGCAGGRWWVMEQQPGPVNWANYNPAPLPGMVRAWTWEAFAHGAEVVSYFRWRQVPFAQEQMHAGLHLPDRSEDIGAAEARQVAREIAVFGQLKPCAKAKVALVFTYESDWMTQIQPQGRGYRALRATFEMYCALRALGMDVDVVSPSADLSGYVLIGVPSLLHVEESFAVRLAHSGALVLLGPRAGSKTRDFHIPDNLPPSTLQDLMPLQVTRVESLRPGVACDVLFEGERFHGTAWREHVRTELKPLATFDDGSGAWFVNGKIHYLTLWPDAEFLARIVTHLSTEAGLEPADLPEGVRTSTRDGVRFAINYAPEARRTPAPPGATYVLGGAILEPAGVAAWRA